MKLKHPMHDSVVDLIQKAIQHMDDFLRDRTNTDEYSKRLNEMDVDSILAENKGDFQKDPSLVYYLDALMLLSSLQHELEFQITEYGSSVATEDIKNLEELLLKIDPTVEIKLKFKHPILHKIMSDLEKE